MNYPSHILWKLNFNSNQNIKSIFSKKTYKKIISSYNKLLEFGYTFKIQTLNQDLIDEFYPLYKKNIQKKRNGIVRDLYTYYSRFLEEGVSCKLLSLYFDGELQGGLVFVERKTRLSAVIKYFPVFAKCNIQSSITIVVEYLFFQEALRLEKKGIYHGVDTNEFGVNSEIGLAMFKLQIGCRPYISSVDSTYVVKSDFVWDTEEDVLIFQGSKPKEKISHAILYIKDKNSFEDNLDKYGPLLNASDIQTTIIYNKV
jgi:hypothetical protein